MDDSQEDAPTYFVDDGPFSHTGKSAAEVRSDNLAKPLDPVLWEAFLPLYNEWMKLNSSATPSKDLRKCDILYTHVPFYN